MKSSESLFNGCLYFSTNALARKVTKLATESWEKVGMSPSHAYLLLIALQQPGVQPGAMASELHLTPSTITRLIEKLEEKKLLVRTTDGKTTNVYPTPKAKALHPKMEECIIDFSQKYEEILGAEDSARMIQNINELNDKLDT